MPAFVLKSSCCTSRAPPSPDCVPSRPAITSANTNNKRVSKDHIPSWISVDTTELRAIFEGGIPSDPCRANHITHKNSAKLRELIEGDKFDTESESEIITTKKSSSTLKAVTQKLKKHLSKDGGGVSKRHSRASIGTSEEEVERRAELRRIRERRIREELSNEGMYDDDAKSLSAPGTPLKNNRASAWIPGSHVPLPALHPLYLPPAELNPLEAAYTLLLETDSPLTKTARRQSNPITPNTTLVNSTASLSRRHSSPVLSDWDIGLAVDEPLVYVPTRKRSSVSQMPTAPLIAAQRLPSLTDPFTSAWRLSFSADKRGDHLRKLSQGSAVPVTLNTGLLEDNSPPGRWLHGPGLRSPSQAIVDPEDIQNVAGSASQVDEIHVLATNQDFGGVDGVKDGSTGVHLHEMEISRRLASKGLQSSASSPQLSSWGSHHRGVSSISNASQTAMNERARYMRSTSDSAYLSDRIPRSWGTVVQHHTSSIYPSASSSMQHSRESSIFNLLSLFPGTKGRESTLQREAEASQSVLSLTRSPTVNLSSASLAIPLTRYCRHSTHDDSSLLASETASFREREAELSVVETRFASSGIVRTRNSPVASKFKEEFHVESEELPSPQPRKLSVFNRLAKLAVRSYDGGSKVEELLDIPMPSFNANTLRSPKNPGGPLLNPGVGPNSYFSPLAELDDSANLWGKAVQNDGRAEAVTNNVYIHGRQGSVVRKKSAMNDDLPKSAFGTLFGIGKGKKNKIDINDHKSAAEEYNQRFQERLAVKELVMDSWEEEMAATAAKAKSKSRNIVKKSKPTMPDKRYPATWSRFNSESLSERCISAGARDRVDVKDFAVLGQKEDGETIWCLEHDDDGHHAEIQIEHRGFRDKFGDRIRHKAYKLDTSDEQSQQTSGRRGSLSVAGELEFPELEVLPFTLRTTEQMADEILAEKEEEETKKREEEDKAKRPHIPKLAVRHKSTAATDGSLDVENENENENEGDISFADPRFYDDCVILPDLQQKAKEIETDIIKSGDRNREKKEKYKTWGGRDWDGYLPRTASVNVRGSAGMGLGGSKRRSRNASMGAVVLRKSTDEYFGEVERMETRERERVLNVAEVAWGNGK